MAKLQSGTPGKTFALNWSLNVTKSWNKALEIGVKEKLTDREILGLMKREFPHRSKFQTVSRVRWQYNRNNFGFGVGEVLEVDDPRFLFKHDEDRNPIYENKGGRPVKGTEIKPLQTQVVAPIEEIRDIGQDEPEEPDTSDDFDLSEYSLDRLVKAAEAVGLDVSECQNREELEDILKARMAEEDTEDEELEYDPGAVVVMLTKLHGSRESLQTLLEAGGPQNYLGHVEAAESEMRKAQAVLISETGNGNGIPGFLVPRD